MVQTCSVHRPHRDPEPVDPVWRFEVSHRGWQAKTHTAAATVQTISDEFVVRKKWQIDFSARKKERKKSLVWGLLLSMGHVFRKRISFFFVLFSSELKKIEMKNLPHSPQIAHTPFSYLSLPICFGQIFLKKI